MKENLLRILVGIEQGPVDLESSRSFIKFSISSEEVGEIKKELGTLFFRYNEGFLNRSTLGSLLSSSGPTLVKEFAISRGSVVTLPPMSSAETFL